MSNFDYGAVLTEFILLGNVATQFDRPIHYDPITMQCVGDEEAVYAFVAHVADRPLDDQVVVNR